MSVIAWLQTEWLRNREELRVHLLLPCTKDCRREIECFQGFLDHMQLDFLCLCGVGVNAINPVPGGPSPSVLHLRSTHEEWCGERARRGLHLNMNFLTRCGLHLPLSRMRPHFDPQPSSWNQVLVM